jgi:hypothetical protein
MVDEAEMQDQHDSDTVAPVTISLLALLKPTNHLMNG